MELRRLYELREDGDKKQKEVADFLGISQTQYARYERGAQLIPLKYLRQLALYYNTSIDYILELTDVSKPYPHGKDIEAGDIKITIENTAGGIKEMTVARAKLPSPLNTPPSSMPIIPIITAKKSNLERLEVIEQFLKRMKDNSNQPKYSEQIGSDIINKNLEQFLNETLPYLEAGDIDGE